MSGVRTSAPRLLAGLQAGILASLAVTAWFLLLSAVSLRAPWALLNLLAASLRNHATWKYGFSATTWTGIAAQVFAGGLLGMFLGWILPRPGRQAAISITGFVFGSVLSLLVYQFFWLRFAPGLQDYVGPAAAWMAHFLFGAGVAQFPRFYLRLEDAEPRLPAPPEILEPSIGAPDAN